MQIQAHTYTHTKHRRGWTRLHRNLHRSGRIEHKREKRRVIQRPVDLLRLDVVVDVVEARHLGGPLRHGETPHDRNPSGYWCTRRAPPLETEELQDGTLPHGICADLCCPCGPHCFVTSSLLLFSSAFVYLIYVFILWCLPLLLICLLLVLRVLLLVCSAV